MRHLKEEIGNALSLPTLLFLFLMQIAPNALPQSGIEVLIANLKESPKIINPGEVFHDFDAGKSESSVIVVLRPPPAAERLAEQSKATATFPKNIGGETFYNFQDERIARVRGGGFPNTKGVSGYDTGDNDFDP